MNGGYISFQIEQKKTTLQTVTDLISKTVFRRFRIREGDVIVLNNVWDADTFMKDMAAQGYELDTEDWKSFKVTRPGIPLKMR